MNHYVSASRVVSLLRPIRSLRTCSSSYSSNSIKTRVNRAFSLSTSIPSMIDPIHFKNHGVGVFCQNRLDLLFPSLQHARSEALDIIKEENKSWIRTEYIRQSQFEEDHADGSTVFSKIDFIIEPYSDTQTPFSTMLMTKMPALFDLALEAGARLESVMGNRNHQKWICSLVTYKLLYPKYYLPAHSDGAVAIHVPIVNKGVSAQTIYKDMEETPTYEITCLDTASIAPSFPLHAVNVFRTDSEEKEPVRIMLNVMPI